MPFVSGRDFGRRDHHRVAPPVCIVNESFARQLFPGEDPLGKPCIHRPPRAPAQQLEPGASQPGAFMIVGVVKDSRYSNPRGEVQPLLYMTFLQTSTGRGQMVLQARAEREHG